MKKVFLSIMVLVCVLCTAFGVVACDTGNGDEKVEVTSVSLSETTLTLAVGGTATLEATVSPDNATKKTVTWKSDNTAVATVSNGTVTAVAPGTTKITATADGKKAECSVTVNPADAKMSETEWKAAWTKLDDGKNYSFTMQMSALPTTNVKYNNGTYYEKTETLEKYLVKDGASYYIYTQEAGEWKKASILEANYNEQTALLSTLKGVASTFSKAYASFEYNAGKYTATSMTVDGQTTASNAEVFIDGDSITKIVCEQEAFTLTVTDIGSTEIELPKILEPSAGITYKLNKDGKSAYVYMYRPIAGETEVMIASEYQGQPVTTINSVFSTCETIEKVIIPDSVTTIAGSTFKGCTNLATIIIPDSVNDIGSAAFENTAWFNNQPDGLVYAGKVAYQFKGPGKGTTVDIAPGTNSISPLAFHECNWLQSITIPSSVISIGGMAFYDCNYLTQVVIEEGLQIIDAQAFRDCDFSRFTLVLPSTIKEIGSLAFAGTGLTNITFNGTQNQWDNEVKKDSNWNKEPGNEMNIKVTCTKG